MTDDDKKKIAKIISEIDCPKSYKCVQGCFDRLCKARDCGLDDYVECLEENSHLCEFSLSFGYSKFCKCKLRVCLSKIKMEQ